MYAHPVPSVNHRHRALPLYIRSGRVERLSASPKLFEEPQVVMTNSYTSTRAVLNRTARAMSYNVGAGPIWDMLEDRAWFKESTDCELEETRRPLVHQNVPVNASCELINRE
jgi:transcription factor C subunit 6